MPETLGITPRLPVTNLRRTADFYAKCLDIEVNGLWPENKPTFLMFSRDETRLQFYVPNPLEPCGRGMLGLHHSLIGRVPIE